jgi:PAS domain S-box-containing protein
MKSTAKLMNREDVLKILSEQVPVGACVMQDGRFCYLNSFFSSATGYTADELVGKDSMEIVAPEDRDMVKENTMNMLKGDLRSPYQFRVVCKDRSIIWVMATVRSIQYRGRRATLGNYMEVTERKVMEQAVEESEEKYRELADSITDVFFAMDEHLRYTYWNRASEVLTGIRAEEAVGRSLSEIFPDEPWRRRAEEGYRSVLRTRQPQAFVNDYDIDGRHHILEIKAYPSRGGLSVFVKDITERKQAEDARREAEQEKSALLEEAPVGIVHTDPKGAITYVNRRFESESGYPREEIIGKSGFQLDWFPASTLEFLAERMAARLRGSPAKHWETQFKCKDGRWIWIELEGKVLRRSGVPAGFQIIAANITERKQAEEALRRSEERYRTMLEEMEEGYYEVDIVGNFTFVNDAMSRILGYSRDELIGMNYRTYTPKEHVKTIFQAYNRVYRTGEPLKWFPMPEIRKDGTRILAEDSVFPLRNEKGEVIGFRGISRDITERKRAEEALRQSEERYRTILEETGDGYFETDLAGNFTFVNDAQTRLLGYSGEELIGASFRDFTPEESVKAVLEAYNRMYKTGEPLRNLVDEVIRKDGSHGFAETSAFPIGNDKGEVIGFRGVRRDITEHKQAEEALRRSEDRYRSILEEMEDSYFEVDLGGHFTFVNNSVCRNLGYSKGELIGMSYKDFTSEEDIESVFRVFNEVYQTGTPNKGFPWKVIRKDGIPGFAEASVSLLRDDKGEISGFRGVGRDITERKRMEDALQQSEEKYRALFDSSVIGTIVLDAKTMKMVMANQAAARMFGFGSAEETRGIDPLDLIHPEHREEVLGLARTGLVEQNSHQNHTLRAVRKDGREIWISATGATIKHEGRAAGLISFTDITEQKRQNERLAMADRLASIGELAAGAAHELNNPLAGITGLSQLLMEREVSDDIREDLKVINSEAQRAANVTSNLLTFARKHRPVKQPTQINDVIEDVLKLRAYAHKSNCIVVERHFASDLPEIPLDHFQMQQVLLNIVINAEYFMTQAQEKGTLTITTKRQDSSVVVSFADDGPGIAAENLGRIFDPFFTTKEAGKGTGLGLSICHGIVAEHGGQIYAASQPDKGATISVELPINGKNHLEVMS